MKNTTRILAICAVCLLTSLSAFSQEVTQPSDKSVANNEVKTTPESTKTAKPTVEEKKAAPAKRQSGNSDSWKGFYIGGNIGGKTSNHSLAGSTAPCGGFAFSILSSGPPLNIRSDNGCYIRDVDIPTVNQAGNKVAKPKGFTGGAQVGYNFQAGNFVAGIEVDFNSARQNKTVSGGDNYQVGSLVRPFEVTQTIKTDWLMTVRPRAGFSAGKTLIYGTGGLAVTNLNYQMKFEDFPPISTSSSNSKATADKMIKETKAGWTAGAGAEFKINDKWSVKGEYLYTQFNTSGNTNNMSVVFLNPAGAVSNVIQTPNQIFTSDVKLKSHHFRFGVNYRF